LLGNKAKSTTTSVDSELVTSNSIIFNPADVDEFIEKFIYGSVSVCCNDRFTEQYARKNIIKKMAQSIIILTQKH
jgi:hypothetical protein